VVTVIEELELSVYEPQGDVVQPEVEPVPVIDVMVYPGAAVIV